MGTPKERRAWLNRTISDLHLLAEDSAAGKQPYRAALKKAIAGYEAQILEVDARALLALKAPHLKRAGLTHESWDAKVEIEKLQRDEIESLEARGKGTVGAWRRRLKWMRVIAESAGKLSHALKELFDLAELVLDSRHSQ